MNVRPRLLDFVSSLEEDLVKSASQKAFQSMPDISKAISELTVLKGVGPATASAILAAYAPDVAPFMSDEVNLGLGFLFIGFFSLSRLIRATLSYYQSLLQMLGEGYGGGSWQLQGLYIEAVFSIC